MIYLASPYSAPTASLRRANAIAAARVAKLLVERGLTIYSPVAHGHFIHVSTSKKEKPGMWIRHGLRMLLHCKKMYVLMLPGWNKSKGIREEIDFAIQHDIPILYLTPV